MLRRSSARAQAVEFGQVKPTVQRPFPAYYKSKVEAKKWWCSCGLTKNAPWCDGSHKGTPMKPVKVDLAAGQSGLFCMCKQTKTPPYCDKSHIKEIPKFYRKEIQGAVVGGGIIGAFVAYLWLPAIVGKSKNSA